MGKVWIEAALNGAWTRALQPGIPDTVKAIIAEGIACAKAGAAIIHTHAYDGGGPQTFDWQVYARIIEGIRAEVDALIYPSFPPLTITTGTEPAQPGADATTRFAHIEELATRGLIDFTTVDPGSVNFTSLSASPTSPPGPSVVTPEAYVRHALDLTARLGFHPAFAIYEPGFTRAGAALARAWGVKTPLYRFMFSDGLAFGFPPRPYALAAHLALLEEAAGPAPWMIAGLGVDIRPLIPEAVARGGHIRVGLEDAPLGTEATNVALVEEAVRLVEAAGGTPASATETRQMLGANRA